MPRYPSPIVLITRPKSSSDQFVTALEAAAGAFRHVICPAFEYEGTNCAIGNFDAAIFTSRAGVSFAPAGAGRPAFCVGDATAEAARQAGYEAISARGNAKDLIDLILRQADAGLLLHIRGETSVGDVTRTLSARGVNANTVIAYRKAPVIPKAEALADIAAVETVILPLFSAETVSIMSDWPIPFERTHLVALSAAVAEAAAQISPASVTISDAPNLQAMVAATSRLIA